MAEYVTEEQFLLNLENRGFHPGTPEIVFDTGEEKTRRFAAGESVLKKVFCSEEGTTRCADAVCVYMVFRPGKPTENALEQEGIAQPIKRKLDLPAAATPHQTAVDAAIAAKIRDTDVIAGGAISYDEDFKVSIVDLEEIIGGEVVVTRNRAHMVDEAVTFTPFKVQGV